MPNRLSVPADFTWMCEPGDFIEQMPNRLSMPADFTWMCEPEDFIELMPNRLSVNQLILFEYFQNKSKAKLCEPLRSNTSW